MPDRKESEQGNARKGKEFILMTMGTVSNLETKKCKLCLEERNMEQFGKSWRNPGKTGLVCRVCVNRKAKIKWDEKRNKQIMESRRGKA